MLRQIIYSLLIGLCLGIPMLLNGQLSIQANAQFQIEDGAKLELRDVDLKNEGTITTGLTSELELTGELPQNLESNSAEIGILKINKSLSANVGLGDDLTVKEELIFMNAPSFLMLNENELTLEEDTEVSGANSIHFVITNGTGKLTKKNLDNFNFPVGATVDTYNPIIVTQNGTVDDISVRVLENALTEGSSGVPFTENVVDASWEIFEENPGDSDLDLLAIWYEMDELDNFDPYFAGIAKHDNSTDWDLNIEDMRDGSFFAMPIENVTPGIFIVSDDALLNQIE